jgi:hypothetical protein
MIPMPVSKFKFRLLATSAVLMLGIGCAWGGEMETPSASVGGAIQAGINYAKDQAQRDSKDIAERAKWILPVASDQRAIHISKSFASEKSTTFWITPFAPVVAPADGRLIYKGPLNASEVGMIISHGEGRYSVISSPIEWEPSPFAPLPGSTVTRGQLLTNAKGNSLAQIPVSWRLISGVDRSFDAVRDLDQFVTSTEATVLGAKSRSDILNQLLTGSEINTNQLLNLGVIQFNFGDNFRVPDDFSLTLAGRKISEAEIVFSAFLLETGQYEVEVTTGRFFKNKTKSSAFARAGGTTTQLIQKAANGDIDASVSNYSPNDVGVLQAATPLVPNEGQEAISEGPSKVTVGLLQEAKEKERLAQAAAKEQERLDQEANSKKQERLTQAEQAKEQERVAEEAKLQEIERLAKNSVVKEQERLAKEVETKKQERLAQEAQAKEKELLIQAASVKEQERLAQDAQATKAALASLDAQKAENERLKVEATAANARQQALEKQLRAAETARLVAAQAVPAMREVQAHALVIGNASYGVGGKLANPTNDAKAMSRKLRSLGFVVTEVLDANRGKLVSALSQFSQKSSGADISILFYAGHGVQIAGTNYMLPVDLDLNDLNQVPLQGISLNSVVEQYLPGKTKLVFLDACRDNPLVRVASRSLTRGLAPINVSEGTLIAYATKDGQVAQDGDGINSPFTAALLEHLSDPDDIAVVLRKVRQKVMKNTGNRQQPWEYGSLTGGSLVLSSLRATAK